MRFQLYVSRQLLVAFLFAVGCLLFVALPGIIVSAVHKLPNVEPLLLLRYLPLVLKALAPYVLPLCFMLSVVAVYGRLAADREWIAVQMSGIWPMRLLLPPLVLGTILAGWTYWMVSEELPKLRERQNRFLVDATASVIENLQPGKTSLSLGDFYLSAAERDEETGTFYDAYIRLPEGEDLSGDIFAGSVEIRIDGRFLEARLRNWEAFDPRVGTRASNKDFQFRVDIAEKVGSTDRNYAKARFQSSSEIRARLRGEGASGAAAQPLDPDDERRMRFELHRRAAMAAAFFLFLGLGAPTGLLLRRGTQLGALAVAAGYGILYYVFSMRAGKQLALADALPVWVGPWITTIAGSLVALVLLQKAMRR